MLILSTGLVGHLKHFPVMYRLYEVLHKWLEPPTEEEKDITSGKRVLEKDASREYLSQLESASKNIVKAMEKQAAKALVHDRLQVIMFPILRYIVGQLGPGQIRASSYRMDHRLQPTFWRSGMAWVPGTFGIYSSYRSAVAYSWTSYGGSKGQRDGHWVSNRYAQDVWGRSFYLCTFSGFLKCWLGASRQSIYLSWLLDVTQWLHIHGHCCPLCYQKWQARYVPSLFLRYSSQKSHDA